MLIFTYDVDLGGSPEDRAAFEAYLEKKTGEKCLVLDLNCTGVFRATKEGNEPVEVVFVRPVPRGSAEQCGDENESSHIAARKGADHARGTVNAEVIKVIRTVGMEGVGTKDDPCRYKIKYWSLEGKLLAVGCEEDDE